MKVFLLPKLKRAAALSFGIENEFNERKEEYVLSLFSLSFELKMCKTTI